MAEEEVVRERKEPGSPSQRKRVYEVPSKGPKVVDYDFRHPQRFSKDQLETIWAIYEAFGRAFATSMGTQIGASLEVGVDDIRHLSYQEFISSLPSPTCLGIVNMDPWKGVSLIEVNNTIILAIIDHLLGGSGEVKEAAGRELTEIELEVTKSILERMLEALKPAWAEIEELSLNLRDITVNPERVQLIPPEEIVLAAILSIKIGEIEGAMRHGIPYNLIDPIAERLTSQYKYSSDQEAAMNTEVLENLREGIQGAPVKVTAELGRVQISMGDILGLQIGDVVKLISRVNDDLILKVGDQKKFLCRPGVIGSRMAVQVTQVNGKG